MASRFKGLKAQYDEVKLGMSKRKVHEFLEKLFQLAENMESANDCTDGVLSELIDRQKAEIAELNQQLDNLEYNRKVRIPVSMADYIRQEPEIEDISLMYIMKNFTDSDFWTEYTENKTNDKYGDWSHLLAKAVMYGYEAEEEPKYYIKLPDIGYLKLGNWRYFYSSETDEATSYTEQEIKDIDERYWPFAVPVEEVKDE